jgi:hypothetical protein
MASVVTIEPTQALAAVAREKQSRGYVYVVADRFGSHLVVSQNMKRIIEYLNGAADEEAPLKQSALYEAASLRSGVPYRHRWRVMKLDLPDSLPVIAKEIEARSYGKVVAVGAPSAYRVVAC